MPHILVVEDEEHLAIGIKFNLEAEGFTVRTVGDGQAALTFLNSAEESVDLVVLDLMLPGMNGLDLCRLLRHQAIEVPILVLSAKGTETDRVVGLEIGADDYLPKPFGMRELVARCRALLRRHQGQAKAEQEKVLSFEDITLHPKECRFFLRGNEVSLSPKEFRIMELFLSQPRRVWSRDQIIDQVWGHDFMGDNKTVDVHIRWIREKLEVEPGRPRYLQTVRGFGYRLG